MSWLRRRRRETISELAAAATRRYRDLCNTQGVDPEVELATIRLTTTIPVEEWIAARLAHPEAPVDDPEALLDEAGRVRGWPLDALAILATHDPAAALHKTTGVSRRLAHLLATDPDPVMRLAAATSARTSHRVLHRLLNDPDRTVAEAAMDADICRL